jgi:ABC-type amino acid transport substrate-binding protein
MRGDCAASADLTQNAKDATVVRYDDDAGMITAVVTGQADLVGTSNAIFQAIKEKAPQRPLRHTQSKTQRTLQAIQA